MMLRKNSIITPNAGLQPKAFAILMATRIPIPMSTGGKAVKRDPPAGNLHYDVNVVNRNDAKRVVLDISRSSKPLMR